MNDLQERIRKALDRVRPFLHADGGDVKVLRVTDEGILEVRWEGTCTICPLSQMTLRAGVERVVMNECPEIKRVEAVVS
jgi:Fe-S cluster biogenesis protein NfuA